MAPNLERPTIEDYKILGKRSNVPIRGSVDECKTEEEATRYAINKLLKSKSNSVMFLMDAYKNTERLISPKMVTSGWSKKPASWDLDDPTHELSVAHYLFLPGGQPEPNPFVVQVDGQDDPEEPEQQEMCTACAHNNGSGPFKECVTAKVDTHDVLKGACTNCYYKLGGANCSLAKEAKKIEKSLKRAARGGFGGMNTATLNRANDDELRELYGCMAERVKELKKWKEDWESPRKRHKK